jgi:amino acid transporter
LRELGFVRSIWVSWLAGFALLVGLTFAIQDYAGTRASTTSVPPAQIFLDALGTNGATALLLVVIVAQLFCGNAEVAAASRMVFAFSRDNALPGTALWRKVSGRTRSPVAAVWLSVTAAGVLALPSLYSTTAYGAVTAINVIGITPAYAIPVYLRLRAGDRFEPGPWNLGRWSRPIGWVAVVWVAFVTVLFCLPQSSPVTVDSMNYASVALIAVLFLASVWWYAARRAYATPAAAVREAGREQAEFA